MTLTATFLLILSQLAAPLPGRKERERNSEIVTVDGTDREGWKRPLHVVLGLGSNSDSAPRPHLSLQPGPPCSQRLRPSGLCAAGDSAPWASGTPAARKMRPFLLNLRPHPRLS